MKRFLLGASLVVALAGLSGCASSLSGSAYSRDQARVAQDVEYGRVEAVRVVAIEGTKSNIGAGAGAIAGGVAGSGISSGTTTRTVGALAGAVIGGMAGAAAEEGITRQNGLEITVRLDSGRSIAVVQAADVVFHPGDRVRVLHGRDGATRISY
ncbi:MAG: glycine zipper 2TM domain-containing protein [Halothiobacillaceae bacterium]|jgi:outer membrane lipoprotein SlyB|nr:MAG: glycine zipper 2TM domain-containing protein [Halothiobacillaceae bacterium]